jgi:hypothetical protein
MSENLYARDKTFGNIIKLSEEQRAHNNRIAGLPREMQAHELLKWALARVTFYGHTNDLCACALRGYLTKGEVTSI